MPFVRGARRRAARCWRRRTPAGVVVDVDAGEQREGAVVQLHRGALGGLDGGGDLQQLQAHRLVGAEQLPEAIRNSSA